MTMTYHIERLPGEPIIVSTILPGYSVVRDQPNSDADTRAILDQSDEPLYLVVDITRFKFNLDDVVRGANQGGRGAESLWHHPKIKKLIWVSPSPVVRLAARGLNSPTFGGIAAEVFDTIDEALAYARAQEAGGS